MYVHAFFCFFFLIYIYIYIYIYKVFVVVVAIHTIACLFFFQVCVNRVCLLESVHVLPQHASKEN